MDLGTEFVAIEGVISFADFAQGSKSASTQPFLMNGDGRIRITCKGDNPFENSSLRKLDGQRVRIKGCYSPDGSVFEADSVEVV